MLMVAWQREQTWRKGLVSVTSSAVLLLGPFSPAFGGSWTLARGKVRRSYGLLSVHHTRSTAWLLDL